MAQPERFFRPPCSSPSFRPIFHTLYPISLAALATTCFVSAVDNPWFHILLAAVTSELLFFIWFHAFHLPHLSKRPLLDRPSDDGDPLDAFHRFIANTDNISHYMSIQSCLTRWFHGADFESIKRDNVAEFFTYGFYYSSREEIAEEGLPDLPEYFVSRVEEAWGIKFSPGYNPNLRFMSHLWEPLRCAYRPLFFYVVMEVTNAAKHLALLSMGFRTGTINGFRYYHNLHRYEPPRRSPSAPPGRSPPTPRPILFLHGIGLGLTPYIVLVRMLMDTAHPVIAVESRHLAMRLGSSNPNVDEIVAATIATLDLLGVPSACTVAHSYGTFTASRLVKRQPHRVHSLVLVDPVCMGMFTGHLVKNFVYKSPRRGMGWATWLGDLTTWTVSRDVHSAASVARGLYWSQLNLWADQLPANTLVVLAENDELVPAAEVRTMLQRETRCQLMWHAVLGHADFLFEPTLQRQMVQRIAAMLKGMRQAQSSLNSTQLNLSPSSHRASHKRHDSASSCVFVDQEKGGAGEGAQGGRKRRGEGRLDRDGDMDQARVRERGVGGEVGDVHWTMTESETETETDTETETEAETGVVLCEGRNGTPMDLMLPNMPHWNEQALGQA